MRNFFIIVILVLAGAGVYETTRASRWQQRVQNLQEQSSSEGQIEQYRRELVDATNALADAQEKNSHLRKESVELPALRSELTRLQKGAEEWARLKATAAETGTAIDDWRLPILIQIRQCLEQRPETKIPELQLLDNLDWLGIAQYDQIKLDTEDHIRQSLCYLRQAAKYRLVHALWKALEVYTNSTSGDLPNNFSQLQPYFPTRLDDAILQRYQIVQTGRVKDLLTDKPWVVEKAVPVDPEHDNLFDIGPAEMTHWRNFNTEEREREVLMKLRQKPSLQ